MSSAREQAREAVSDYWLDSEGEFAVSDLADAASDVWETYLRKILALDDSIETESDTWDVYYAIIELTREALDDK